MSLHNNIDHLAAASGVIALSVDAPEKQRLFRGAERWRPILDGAINLLRMTGESTIRLVIGDHTMVVQHELKETVAVVIPTGHAIAKSLRRMIRRMARKDRGPFIAEPAAPQATEAQTRAPTQPQATPLTRGPGIQQHSQKPAAPAKPVIPSAWDRFSS
ncbi:MAG: hypothetical protein KC486_07095 [Myxococcales bacterium]|nr:hypothetical protein [Myxococcales bacterium]